MRVEVVEKGGALSGAAERWRTGSNSGHHYGAACEFACRTLGPGPGMLLCIGSPQHEVQALSELGWEVTFMDVRRAPWAKEMRVLDVQDLEDVALWDAISSTCVLTHVGSTRYGDRRQESGDVDALRRMRRALKLGGKIALQLGGVIEGDTGVLVGETHRVYTHSGGVQMVREAGFEELEIAVWSRGGGWAPDARGHVVTSNPTAYLSIAGVAC